MRSSRLLPVLCGLALLAAACTPRPPESLPTPALSAAEVARVVAAPLAAIAAIDGQGIIKITDHDSSQVTDMYLTLTREDGLRVDVMSPFGTPVLTSLMGPDSLLVLDYTRGQAWRGPATADALAKVLRFRVTPDLLMDALRGGLTAPDAAWAADEPGANDRRELWYYRANSLRVGIDPEHLRLVQLDLLEGEPLAMRWGDFRRVDGVDFAHRVEIERPASQQSVMLKFREVALNAPPADRSLFHPEIPEGWRVKEIGD